MNEDEAGFENNYNGDQANGDQMFVNNLPADMGYECCGCENQY